MQTIFRVALFTLSLLGAVSAQQAPSRIDIYPSGLVLVEETRTVDLPVGRSQIRIDLVRGNADVSTLELIPLDRPDQVRVVAMVRRNDLPAATFVEVDSPGGPERLSIRFQARGLSAAVHYSGVVDPAQRTFHLVQELEVTNASGQSFTDVAVRSIIGDIKTVPSTVVMHGRAPDPAAGTPAGLPATPLIQDFAQHTAITFGEDVSLPAGVTVRRRTLEASRVAIEIEYRFDANAGTRVSRILKARNAPESDLGGATLQPGALQLYALEPGGTQRFLSKTSFPHVAPGGSLELAIGSADDFVVEREPMDLVRSNLVQGEYNRALVSYDQEEAFRLKIRNHAAEARTLVVWEHVTGADRFEVLESSTPSTPKDRTTLEFRVEVPASGATVLTYRVKKISVKL